MGDDGARQAIVRTVLRRGFKLAVDVAKEDGDPVESEASPGSGEEQPVLAVFPFGPAGAGEHPDYLLRGIADDIATELSRFHTIAVISTFVDV